MKYIKTLAIVAFVFAANSLSAQAIQGWPAMKEFHEVMSRSFHPTEQGNFEPLRNFAETLAFKAGELSTKDIPKEYKTKELMEKIAKLQAKTQEIAKLVKAKAADQALKQPISDAHDIFHEIVGMCNGEKH